jgi:hypothetical protein
MEAMLSVMDYIYIEGVAIHHRILKLAVRGRKKEKLYAYA